MLEETGSKIAIKNEDEEEITIFNSVLQLAMGVLTWRIMLKYTHIQYDLFDLL